METDSTEPWVQCILGEVRPSPGGFSCTENTQQMNISNHLIQFSITLRHTARITPRPKTVKSGILYRKKKSSVIPQRCKPQTANVRIQTCQI